MKHRGSLMCVVGALGAAASLLVLEGGVQLVSGVVSLGIAGVGAAVHHHQRTRTTHRSPNVYAPTWRERRDYERARRDANGAVPQFNSGPVHVTGSDRARPHTRARPGEAQAS